MKISLFNWAEINKIPNDPGIYAWYYRNSISNLDISKAIQEIVSLPQEAIQQKKETLKTFLEKNIFSPFEEQPYLAEIKGALKPNYSGQLYYNYLISDSLLERLIEDPDRLYEIKSVLSKTTPGFASPIYIGMASNLKRRLSCHKYLIDKYKGSILPEYFNLIDFDGEERDYNFAKEVVNRNLDVNDLLVTIEKISSSINIQSDLENILNRINYPLCGRN